MKKYVLLAIVLFLGSVSWAEKVTIDTENPDSMKQGYALLAEQSAEKSTIRLVKTYERLSKTTQNKALKAKIDAALPQLQAVQSAF